VESPSSKKSQNQEAPVTADRANTKDDLNTEGDERRFIKAKRSWITKLLAIVVALASQLLDEKSFLRCLITFKVSRCNVWTKENDMVGVDTSGL